MSVVSLAQACRCLVIDAKTLRRWLDEAQIPLQGHPCDGRKKGINSEHLELLARLHHRHLDTLVEALPPSAPTLEPSLPSGLLALPEVIAALQTQISALQQQVAALTLLLQPPLPVPQPTPTRRSSTSTPPPRSRPKAHATKTHSKPVHIIPRVEYGHEGRYVVICPTHGLLSFEPDTPEWFAWLATQSSFRFVGNEGHFTAHHEWTTPNAAWRAHRQIRNHSYNLHLAPNQELTIAVLEQAAQTLHAHLA